MLFPTVCFIVEHTNVTELNHKLETYCLEQEEISPRHHTDSIKGGYHSHRQFFETDHAAVGQLKALILDGVQNYLQHFWEMESTAPLTSIPNFTMQMTGWSVILREGEISTPHTHPGAHLSGVYYVTTKKKTPETQNTEGNLVLVDPRIRASAAPLKHQKTNALFEPKPGVTVMFPSFLEHYVLPFKGDGVRISIAYNITFPPNALQRD